LLVGQAISGGQFRIAVALIFAVVTLASILNPLFAVDVAFSTIAALVSTPTASTRYFGWLSIYR
jgi:hypothetical protein